MFERWAGPVWGLRIWRLFFGVLLLGVVGGIAFGGWRGYREIWPADQHIAAQLPPKTVYVPTPDPAQAREIQSLKAQLVAAGAKPVGPQRQRNSVGPVTGSGNIIAPGMSGGTNNIFQAPADRRLSPIQTSVIRVEAAGFCSGGTSLSVTAANANQEAQRYATDFVYALNAKGCKASLNLPIPGLRPEIVGVLIGVRNPAAIPSAATALGAILKKANIDFTFSRMEPDFFPADQLVLAIGADH